MISNLHNMFLQSMSCIKLKSLCRRHLPRDHIFNDMILIVLKWHEIHNDSTYCLIFWSRKVFEGVQNHVRICFEKAGLVHFFFFSKFMITCQKASLVHIQIVRKVFSPNLDQTCLFEATQHVILDSFKHFSGPKYKIIRN